MARLPSSVDLSGQPSLRSGRVIAQVDTSGFARGIQSLGNSLSSIGGEIADQREKQRNALDITRAEAAKTKGLLGVENDFKYDPEYETFDKRAPQRTSEVLNNAAGLIRDPQKRELWLAGAQADAARYNDKIIDWGAATQHEAELVALDDALETSRQIYVDPDVADDERDKAKADIVASIGMAEEVGLLSPDQAEARRSKFIDDATFTRGKLAVERNPDIISQPLPKTVAGRAEKAMSFYVSRGYTQTQAAGIVGNLIAESNLDPIVAPGDNGTAFGIAQWRGSRLTKLKRFANANGRDWRDFETQLAFVDVELQDDERTAYNNLKKATTVDEATAAMIGYERPRHWTPDNPRAGHNWKGRLKYASMAAGQEVNPDWYNEITPTQRFAIDRQVETERNKQSAELRGQIEVTTQNAPTAILNTGEYSGSLPSLDQFQQAYGPQDGAIRYSDFMAQVQTSQEAHGMQTMSAADIERMVMNARPTSSGDNAAREQASYDTLTSAASATLKAREAEPANYVRQAFPSVDAAWQAADTPEGYQQAIAASVSAQRQLGISNVQPLPKSVAVNAVAGFNNTEASDQERMASVESLVFATRDPDQQRAIFKQMVDAGVPPMIEGVMEAAARGDQGAARRLMRAALVDPADLPKDSTVTPSMISQRIYSDVWEPGQIGAVAYGLSYGDVSSLERAQRGTDLMKRSVQLRMAQGEDLQSAIDGAKADMFGDVKVYSGAGPVNAELTVPSDMPNSLVTAGLEAVKPQFADAMEAQRQRIIEGVDAPSEDASKAILDATTQNRVDDVMSNGVFVRIGEGVGLRDPYTGQFVADENGEPLSVPFDVIEQAGMAEMAKPAPDAAKAGDRAYEDAVGPDWMKAREREAAAERARQGLAETPAPPRMDMTAPEQQDARPEPPVAEPAPSDATNAEGARGRKARRDAR